LTLPLIGAVSERQSELEATVQKLAATVNNSVCSGGVPVDSDLHNRIDKVENQIKSNKIYLQAQNIKENAYDQQKVEQIGTSTNRSASRTQRQRNCSNMSRSTI